MSAIVLHCAPTHTSLKPVRVLLSGPIIALERTTTSITGGQTDVIAIGNDYSYSVLESIDDIANMLNACYIPRDADK